MPSAPPFARPTDRATFLDHVERALPQRDGVAVIALDIDRFQAANDALGQHACDEILTSFGHRLRDAAGPDAVVARVGGDAFAVLCKAVGTEREALTAGCRADDTAARKAGP